MAEQWRTNGGERNENGALSSFQNGDSTSRKRKSVQIAEDRNETRVFARATTTTDQRSQAYKKNDDAASNGASLLAEAEQKTPAQKINTLTAAGAKAASVALKRAIEVNALQRAKGGAAETYLESEVALYEQIAALKAFAAADDVAVIYPALQETATADLIQLLLHDNMDIAVAVTSLFLEWLDLDLATRPPTDESGSSSIANSAPQQRINVAVIEMAATVVSDAAELLVDNFARIRHSEGDNDNGEEEDDDDDVGRGVEDVLSLLENLLEMDNLMLAAEQSPILKDMSVAASLCRNTRLVSWLLSELQESAASGNATVPYRSRCMELLSYLTPKEDIYTFVDDWSRIPLYTSPFLDDGEQAAKPKGGSKDADKQEGDESSSLDGIEIVLQCVAAFRKRQPTNEAEIEFLENGCMVLSSLLTFSPSAVQAFLDAQGVEFVIRCLKERVYAGALALKWLDFSGTNVVNRRACEHVVQAGALKYVFPLFMGHNVPKYHTKAVTVKQKKAKREFQLSIESTTIRVLYALIRHLREDSPNDAMERVLAKFVDDSDGGENLANPKIGHLVDLLLSYDQRARLAEYKFFRSDVEEALLGDNGSCSNGQAESLIALAALEAKLAAGGDLVHRLAAISAFCCVGSQQCHQQVLAALQAKDSGIGMIHAALEEFVSALDDASDQKKQIESYLAQI